MKRLFIQQLQQLATDRWARQGVRTLLRAATLAASIWCIWLGGHLLWGWPLRFEWMGALALMVIGFSVASLLRPRMTPEEAARRLDQRFHLDEQLSTALEIAATNPPPGSVAARLLAQSDYTAQTVAKSISRRQKPPWNDFLSLVVLLPVLIGLYILSGVSSTPQPAAPLPLPPLVAPGQEPPLPPFPPEQAGEQPGAVPDSPSQQEVPTSSILAFSKRLPMRCAIRVPRAPPPMRLIGAIWRVRLRNCANSPIKPTNSRSRRATSLPIRCAMPPSGSKT
jgi:hypothetical protein